MQRLSDGLVRRPVYFSHGEFMPAFGAVDINRALQMIVIILIAIDIHELAHAVVADRLGDPTPRRMGEISLNPFVHMDQIGILLLLITSISQFGFTYGRTHVTPTNLKFGPQRGNAIVAIAGPLANLASAAVLGSVLTLAAKGVINPSIDVENFILLAIFLNSLLFVINLIPLPPLDGFTVLGGFLTARQMYSLAPLQQWGPLIILLIFVLNPGGFFGNVVYPAVVQILNLVCGSCPGVAT
jgi:Zn-dependent protease